MAKALSNLKAVPNKSSDKKIAEKVVHKKALSEKHTSAKSSIDKMSHMQLVSEEQTIKPKVNVTPPPSVTRPVYEAKKLTEDLVQECKFKLLNSKTDLLNRVKEARGKLDQSERGGDEADQTMRILAEQELMNLTDRLRSQLLEIESALGRIENGSFGFCEETEEPIEIERLRAIPWTRLSIEGAEIRESVDRRYAR